MSWSKSVHGTSSQVIEQSRLWDSEVENADRAMGALAAVLSNHQSQVRAARQFISTLADTMRDTDVLTASCSGHAGETSGQLNVSYTFA